jgi:hypothetical protein
MVSLPPKVLNSHYEWTASKLIQATQTQPLRQICLTPAYVHYLHASWEFKTSRQQSELPCISSAVFPVSPIMGSASYMLQCSWQDIWKPPWIKSLLLYIQSFPTPSTLTWKVCAEDLTGASATKPKDRQTHTHVHTYTITIWDKIFIKIHKQPNRKKQSLSSGWGEQNLPEWLPRKINMN